jgi:ABC-type sugar transport system, periplasmic component
MKKLKRMLALLLCLAMTVTSFIGCGKSNADQSKDGATAKPTAAGTAAKPTASENKEIVNLNMALLKVYDTTDAPKVQEALNKVLGEKYGINVKITYIDFGSWTEQTNLLLTGDEVDVLPLFMLPLTSYVNNGQVLCLDDYYANASDAMKKVWSEDELKGTMVDGKLYSITNLRNFANKYVANMSEKMVKEMNIDVSSIKSLADLEKVLYQVKKKYPDVYPLVPQQGDNFVNGWTWDGLGDENWIGVLPNKGQDTTVQNILDTNDFKEFTSYTHKWYKDGLIMADALSNTETGTTMIANGKAFAALGNSSNAAAPAGCVQAQLIDPWSVSNSMAALSYAININSKHPDESWKLIEAMYTDKDVATLLIDGMEGTHYIKNEDGTISYPKGVTAPTSKYGQADAYWSYPNGALTAPLDYNGKTFFTDLINFNKTATISKANGFSFDQTEVSDEYAACINVMSKYYKALLCGSLDPAATISKADKELKDSGIDDIIAAKQSQLDKFIGK